MKKLRASKGNESCPLILYPYDLWFCNFENSVEFWFLWVYLVTYLPISYYIHIFIWNMYMGKSVGKRPLIYFKESIALDMYYYLVLAFTAQQWTNKVYLNRSLLFNKIENICFISLPHFLPQPIASVFIFYLVRKSAATWAARRHWCF